MGITIESSCRDEAGLAVSVVSLERCGSNSSPTSQAFLSSNPATHRPMSPPPSHISKLGGRFAFFGKFSDDKFGYMLADILRKKNGVEDEGVLFDPHACTVHAFVTLKSNGEREFMFYRNTSADMLLTESELNFDLIRRTKIFHYGSISLIFEPYRSAHLAAMRVAKEAGILLS